ncbi:MAG: cyclodeaminase/cyclohydrolase family protein [Candidatus Bipolaricaulis sp.]|nr:cyclodeaminase/cyclohydrolase family protein [Candidatus Bipolaricaulis sp.]
MTDRSWTEDTLTTYLDRLASGEPTPGGGSAACVAGALGAGLGSMVVAVAQKKGGGGDWAGFDLAFRTLGESFLRLAEDDEAAFAVVMDALRLPKGDPSRPERLEQALEEAATVPLQAAEQAVQVLRHLEDLLPYASVSIISDVGAAAHLALAALRSSLLNVDVNRRGLTDPDRRAQLVEERRALDQTGVAIHDRIAGAVSARLASESHAG